MLAVRQLLCSVAELHAVKMGMLRSPTATVTFRPGGLHAILRSFHVPARPQTPLAAWGQGLLGRVRDHNRQVQEAACSALATLEEAAGGVLVPRLPAILDTLAGAVPAYSRRNLRLLYDSLSTLADAVGPALAEVGPCAGSGLHDREFSF